ncbi:MAG: efflux RND transporter periplasmic adaptor subunit [Gammaproteobacteria bacterium]|nr:efflux RND transporter periplasmic adaptor subunit [Gammaproteobacteria bacterium]MCH9744973.1 efflux RND transporter periplasmic adaptor subunit [Gammaproteobacteria bacterium]
MNIRKIIIFIIVVAIILGIGFGWYYWPSDSGPAQASVPQVIAVRVAKVKRSTITNTVYAVGTLQAKQQINVAPQMDGKIVAILYKPGSFVKQNTVLFQLDDRIYQARLRSAQSALNLAKMNFERSLQLAKTGAQSKQTLDSMRATFEEAQAALSSDQTVLSEARIRAPFSGYVGPQLVSIGDYVRQGQTLTTLTDRSILQVNYSLPEQYLQQLQLGQKVRVILPNHKHEKFIGKLSYISPTVDDTTDSVDLEADIPNPKNILAPGLFVKVKQVLGMNRNALVVPIESLVSTITGSQVYRIENHRARAISVKTGATSRNHVEILKGLKQGDVVVTAGQQELIDGSHVSEVQ